MPLLQIAAGRILPDGLPERLAALVGAALDVPAARVMVVAAPALVHLGGSTRPPAVLADLSAARQPTTESARALAESLSAALSEALGAPPSRIYVRILSCPETSLWRSAPGGARHAGEP